MHNTVKKNPLRGLHFRIAFFVVITILVIFGLFSAYQFMSFQNRLSRIEKESSELLGLAISSSLEIAMLNSDRGAIQHSLNQAAQNETIIRIFLLNNNMEVKASSDQDQVGQLTSLADPGCRECHQPAASGQIPTSIELAEEEALRVVIPVVNKPSCFGCHDAGDRINGLLVLDRSLRPARAELYAAIKRAILIAALAVLVLMFLFRWYIKNQIINRVAYLESLARRVVDNELDLDIELAGEDELSSLARSFNNMKTTLRLSMERIEGHRNYLNALLDNLTDGIVIIDDLDQIVFVNRSLSRVLESGDPEPQPGDNAGRLLWGQQQLGRIEELVRSVREKKTIEQDVVRLQSAALKERYLEVHTGRLLLPPRREPEVMIVIRDVTAIITFEKQMYQSERLATVGRLAAGVAHEINNPMASILTCTEGLIKNNRGGDPSTSEYLEIIRNSAHRCKMITAKLLGYSAASSLNKESLDLGQVLGEAVTLLQFEASTKDAKVELVRTEALPFIQGSRDSLLQVFVNLILNSIQAVPTGGSIEVTARATEERIIVLIKDDGPGISEDNLKRVFEPFFTTKPIGEGTGLGLSVSQGIIKQHDGQIEIVDGRAGRTCLKVSIPIESERESTPDGI